MILNTVAGLARYLLVAITFPVCITKIELTFLLCRPAHTFRFRPLAKFENEKTNLLFSIVNTSGRVS